MSSDSDFLVLSSGEWRDGSLDLASRSLAPCTLYQLYMSVSYISNSGNTHREEAFSREIKTDPTGHFQLTESGAVS